MVSVLAVHDGGAVGFSAWSTVITDWFAVSCGNGTVVTGVDSVDTGDGVGSIERGLFVGWGVGWVQVVGLTCAA